MFEVSEVTGHYLRPGLRDSCFEVLNSVKENGFAFIENPFGDNLLKFIEFKISIGNGIYDFAQQGNNVNTTNTMYRIKYGDVSSIKQLSSQYITPVYERHDGWFTNKKTRNAPVHNGVTYDIPFLRKSFKLGIYSFETLYRLLLGQTRTNYIRDVKIDIGTYLKIYENEEFYRIGFIKRNGVKINIKTPQGNIFIPFLNEITEKISMFILAPGVQINISGGKSRFVIMATLTSDKCEFAEPLYSQSNRMYRDINTDAMNILKNVCK